MSDETDYESINKKLQDQFRSWRDGSLLEPELLKIYQTIIDDGMQCMLGGAIELLCNDLLYYSACTPRKPRPLPPRREQ